MTNILQATADAASEFLSPRAYYARDVLHGRQRWSGSDLRGKAKKYGGSYAIQRSRARRAWHLAGGSIIPVEHGLLIRAVRVGTDDYGNGLYITTRGLYTPGANASSNCVRVSA